MNDNERNAIAVLKMQGHRFWMSAIVLDAIDTLIRSVEADDEKLKVDVYAWLGFWRDNMPDSAVEGLQKILGPLGGSNDW